MQPRTLQVVLVEVENILPDVKEVIVELRNKLKAIQKGNWHVEMEDKGESNLDNLVAELELTFKNTPTETLEKNIIARTKTAIAVSHMYITHNKKWMLQCMQTLNGVLRGEIRLIEPTTPTSIPSQRRSTVDTLFFQGTPIQSGGEVKSDTTSRRTANGPKRRGSAD